MHTTEETASLLASLASFSLFPTSKDDDAQGHFVSQRRWAISPSAGKGRGEIGQIQYGYRGRQHKFNG